MLRSLLQMNTVQYKRKLEQGIRLHKLHNLQGATTIEFKCFSISSKNQNRLIFLMMVYRIDIITYIPIQQKTHRFEGARHVKTMLVIKSNKLLKAHPNMKHRMTSIHISQEM